MKEIKLLGLDMDGTTYVKMGGVVPANIKPIQKAIEQGVEVVFATGRPALAGPNRIKENGFAAKNTLLIAYNGAAIYDVQAQKIIKVHPIAWKTAVKVFQLGANPNYQKTVLWAYVVNDFYKVLTNAQNPTSKKDKPLFYSLEMNFFDGEYIQITPENLKNFDCEILKFLVFDAHPDFLSELRNLGLEVATAENVNAEVTAPNVNKKKALKWVAEQLKIGQQNIMAVGDGANDLAMIKYAGVGVALKNSIPSVKEAADLYVDLTSEEGAVGYLIENYILKKEKENES